MAKKSRRAKKRSGKKRRSIPASGPKQPVPVLVPGPTVTKEPEVVAKGKAIRLAEEYRYVYSDLKRIAILAATMLAALIVLSFVIR